MSHHEETFAVDVPDDSDAAAERLSQFYRHNGYATVDESKTTPNRRIFQRGNRSASWWSSDMSQLKTEITLDIDGDVAQLAYRVITTGQHLTDEDRNFWKREARAADDYLHERAELIDLRPAESRRARSVQKEYRSFGVQAAVIIVFAIVAAGVAGAYLGLL